ncbi:hypothetical protein GCM10027347_61520 [Larkinella harenae]
MNKKPRALWYVALALGAVLALFDNPIAEGAGYVVVLGTLGYGLYVKYGQ